MRQVLPLKGYKSLRALNGFHTLALGLKMLPNYLKFTYEEFYSSFKHMDPAKKETLFREAVSFVDLSQDEVEAMISFCTDANGIPYGPANLSSLSQNEIFEIIVAVCVEIEKIEVTMISEDEKKKYLAGQSTSEEPTSGIPT